MVVIMMILVFHVDGSGRHIGRHTGFGHVTVVDACVSCFNAFYPVFLMLFSFRLLLLKVTVFSLPLSGPNFYFSMFSSDGNVSGNGSRGHICPFINDVS